MKNIIFIFLLCTIKITFAQQNSFFLKSYLQNLQLTGANKAGQNEQIMIANDRTQKFGAIFKINHNGLVIWSKRYGQISDSIEIEFTGICATKDSNFIVIANAKKKSYIISTNGQNSLLILKINTNGDTLWTKMISASVRNISSHSIVESSDHNYMICGSINSISPFPGPSFLLLITKINTNGDLIWSKNYSSNVTQLNGLKIKKSMPNRIIIYGLHSLSYLSFPASDNLFVSAMDSNGTVIWSKFIYDSTSSTISPESINMCVDKNKIILTHNQNNHSYFTKLDTLGNVLWTNKYTLPNTINPKPWFANSIFGSDIISLTNGGYLFCNGDRTPSIFSQLDSNGLPAWSKVIDGSINFITQIDTNSYLCSGNQKTTYENPSKINILKMNLTSQTNCTNTYSTFFSYTSAIKSNPLTFLAGNVNTLFFAHAKLTYLNSTLTDSLVCSIVSNIEEHVNTTIRVFPNPNNGTFTLNYGLQLPAKFSLYNALGQSMTKINIIEETTLLKLEKLPKGIYHYMLKSNDHSVYRGKLMVE